MGGGYRAANMDDFEIIAPAVQDLTPATNKSTIQVPSFGSAIIQKSRTDGYWVETFHFSNKDRVPGIIK